MQHPVECLVVDLMNKGTHFSLMTALCVAIIWPQCVT